MRRRVSQILVNLMCPILINWNIPFPILGVPSIYFFHFFLTLDKQTVEHKYKKEPAFSPKDSTFII